MSSKTDARPEIIVVVDMSGGLVNMAYSTDPHVRVIVIDADTEGGDEDHIHAIDGEEFYISEALVEDNSETIGKVLKALGN